MHQAEPVSLDCRGLACPQPVLQTKKLVDTRQPSSLYVTVDNDAARENVARFLQSRGYAVTAVAEGALWKLQATLEGAAPGGQPAQADAASPVCPACEVMSAQELAALTQQRIAVFIPAATLGQGDDELGTKLMINFVKTLPELGSELWRLILVNGGVHLAVEGSPVLETLQALEREGVTILVCGTCLEFFNSMSKKAVGQTTNMLDVVTSLQLATKIIRA